jgi:hypothetical protein
MWSSDSDPELTAAAASSSSSTSSATSVSASPPPTPPPAARLLRQRNGNRRRRRSRKQGSAVADSVPPVPEPEAEDVWRGAQWEAAWPARRDPKPVVLAVAGGDDAVGRSRSLTDDDLEELKGCADLGFGFSYDEIPELRGTLPALELCYSMTQRLHLVDDDKDKPPLLQQQHEGAAAAPDASAPLPPVTNWKISSPGKQNQSRKPSMTWVLACFPSLVTGAEKSNLSTSIKMEWNLLPSRNQPRTRTRTPLVDGRFARSLRSLFFCCRHLF